MSDRKPSRWLYLLIAGVVLLGTVLVIAGTRTKDEARPTNAARTAVLMKVTSRSLARWD